MNSFLNAGMYLAVLLMVNGAPTWQHGAALPVDIPIGNPSYVAPVRANKQVFSHAANQRNKHDHGGMEIANPAYQQPSFFRGHGIAYPNRDHAPIIDDIPANLNHNYETQETFANVADYGDIINGRRPTSYQEEGKFINEQPSGTLGHGRQHSGYEPSRSWNHQSRSGLSGRQRMPDPPRHNAQESGVIDFDRQQNLVRSMPRKRHNSRRRMENNVYVPDDDESGEINYSSRASYRTDLGEAQPFAISDSRPQIAHRGFREQSYQVGYGANVATKKIRNVEDEGQRWDSKTRTWT